MFSISFYLEWVLKISVAFSTTNVMTVWVFSPLNTVSYIDGFFLHIFKKINWVYYLIYYLIIFHLSACKRHIHLKWVLVLLCGQYTNLPIYFLVPSYFLLKTYTAFKAHIFTTVSGLLEIYLLSLQFKGQDANKSMFPV